MNCQQVREWLGAEPAATVDSLPSDVTAHLASCDACQRYVQEMRALEGSIKRALEVDLAKFRTPAVHAEIAPPQPLAAPRRRTAWALAASVLVVVAAGVSLWALRSETSLASAVVAHMADETGSWNATVPVGQSAIDVVLRDSGARIDGSRVPIVYAHSCQFRGHSVPHLVVNTDHGPVTLMLLRAERVSQRADFNEGGIRGVLWPAPDGHGGIAVLSRTAQPVDLSAQARDLSARISWSAATR